MSAPRTVATDDAALLSQARAGNERAFTELAGVYRQELHAHCYRMLGSMHDAEDALQEALLRAWRGLPGFEGRGSVRAWLYSIATNAALDAARRRSRRELPMNLGPSGQTRGEQDAPLTDLPWLEPYPSQGLGDQVFASPEARYEQRESVELAFVAAMQHLPPMQRAVLLLREVVGMSTTEICAQLGITAAAVNSALQRARAAAKDRMPARSQQATLRLLGDQRIREIAERYADAIERGDADTLIGMLTEDATWSMPPIPSWYRGHNQIREFLVKYPLTDRWKHAQTWASGQLAVGCYIYSEAAGQFVPAVIDVLTLDGDKITAVTAFLAAVTLDTPQPSSWITGDELFARFGLPVTAP